MMWPQREAEPRSSSRSAVPSPAFGTLDGPGALTWREFGRGGRGRGSPGDRGVRFGSAGEIMTEAGAVGGVPVIRAVGIRVAGEAMAELRSREPRRPVQQPGPRARGGSAPEPPKSPAPADSWSGRRDSNPRSRAPKARALANYATPRRATGLMIRHQPLRPALLPFQKPRRTSFGARRRAARPRWEMRCFSSGAYSPKVRPPGGSRAGSKIGS